FGTWADTYLAPQVSNVTHVKDDSGTVTTTPLAVPYAGKLVNDSGQQTVASLPLTELWDVSGNKIQTAVTALKNALDLQFTGSGPVSVRDLVNNVTVNGVPVLLPGDSSNPFEFNVSLPISGTERMVPITFDGTKLHDKFFLNATGTANVMN